MRLSKKYILIALACLFSLKIMPISSIAGEEVEITVHEYQEINDKLESFFSEREELFKEGKFDSLLTDKNDESVIF